MECWLRDSVTACLPARSTHFSILENKNDGHHCPPLCVWCQPTPLPTGVACRLLTQTRCGWLRRAPIIGGATPLGLRVNRRMPFY